MLSVVLLAGSSIVLASRLVTTVVNKQVQTTAAVSAVVVGQQTSNLITLVQSYATRRSLVDGVADGASGHEAVQFNLESLAKAFPGISASWPT